MGTRHVMVDIETMATDSNASLLQIGAVRFNPARKTVDLDNVFEVNVSLPDCRERGMVVDPATEIWWREQSPESIASVLAKPRYTVPEALGRFSAWYPSGALCWSHATFDAVILQNAYQRVDMRCPWHFRDARDLRTLQGLFEFGGRKVPDELWSPPDLVAHRASHDAIRQARIAIVQIRSVLGLD